MLFELPTAGVTGVYACTRKALVSDRHGRRFLSLTLRDANTTIQARAFRNVAWLAANVDRDDIVRVTGHPTTFRGECQIEVASIERVAIPDPERLLPTAYRDLDELDGFLEHFARDEVYDRSYHSLLETLLSDADLRAAWRKAPCTIDGHHAYIGGLLEHTVAVATLAVETATLHPALDWDLLLTAALVHDLGKTNAFTYNGVFGLDRSGHRPGPAVLGLRLLRSGIRRCNMTEPRALALRACLASAHARVEPVGMTLEAAALRGIDALDSAVGARKTERSASERALHRD
jgi:3'-5' exoribonuclease